MPRRSLRSHGGPSRPERALTLNAGTNGTGPGIAGGTVQFTAGTFATVTGPAGIAPISIVYNPTSYLTPTDYTGNFTGTGGPVVSRMLVFPAGGDKAFDGTTLTTLTGLKGLPAGVTLVAGPGNVANFDTPAVGVNKTVAFTGYTLGGPNAAAFALATNCCGPIVSRTTAAITPAVLVVAPIVVPPVVVAPGAVAPVVVVPGVVAPIAPVGAVPEMGFVPGVVMTAMPFVGLPGLNLVSEGVAMPPVVVVQATPVPPPVRLAPPVAPPPVIVPPPPYVPPVFVPRPDRN
jgi:hypothetical protein